MALAGQETGMVPSPVVISSLSCAFSVSIGTEREHSPDGTSVIRSCCDYFTQKDPGTVSLQNTVEPFRDVFPLST